jgi:hypothetical protein
VARTCRHYSHSWIVQDGVLLRCVPGAMRALLVRVVVLVALAASCRVFAHSSAMRIENRGVGWNGVDGDGVEGEAFAGCSTAPTSQEGTRCAMDAATHRLQ